MEAGTFVAEYPSLPGCRAEATSREAALEGLQDAIGEAFTVLNKWVEKGRESDELVDLNL